MIARAPIRSPIRSPLAGSAPLSFPLLDNLVAYWNLSEASGQRNDGHTNAYHLTDNNTVTQAAGVGGGQNAALFTSANSESLSRAGGTELGGNATGWSLSAWVLSPTDTGVRQTVVSTFSANTGYLLRVGSDASDRFLAGVGTGSGFSSADFGPNPITYGNWYHIYLEYTGTALRASANNATIATVVTAACVASTATFRMGDFVASQYWNGRIQAFGFWDRVLTTDERTWLYNSGTAARLYADVSTYTG